MKNHLDKFIKKMKLAGLNDTVINSFSYYYDLVLKGESGKVSKNEIQVPNKKNIAIYNDLDETKEVKPKDLVVIKLNGGLGTSMGLNKAKSLLPVKDDMTFLDIIANQIIYLRKETDTNLPVLFMNSFNTQKDTLDFLKKYDSLALKKFGLDFLQNKFPKIVQNDLSPLETEDDKKSWNPPGHGEIYSALSTSGILDKLIEKGYKYAFISNSDNLGAVYDDKIYSYVINSEIPFLMEVCIRTEMDKKGGHLAETKIGQLMLREVAQCPDDEIDEFQDVSKYKYFNTNTIWVNLEMLKKKLDENNNFLPLPLILNKKNVDNIDVFQLESAMGAAIQIFENSKAVVVPRSRFLPVKKTNDLLTIWSDLFKLNSDYRLTKTTDTPLPTIELDAKYYQKIDDFSKHFSKGIPSLKECQSLKIEGNVSFGENVKIVGNIHIKSEDKKFIENEIIR